MCGYIRSTEGAAYLSSAPLVASLTPPQMLWACWFRRPLCPSSETSLPFNLPAPGPAGRDGGSAQLENYAVLNGEIVGNIIFGGLHVRNCLSEAFYS
jgi:hypothetical protein